MHRFFHIRYIIRLTVPWVGLQFVIVVFPDHTHLLFHYKPSSCYSLFQLANKVMPLSNCFERLFKTYPWKKSCKKTLVCLFSYFSTKNMCCGQTVEAFPGETISLQWIPTTHDFHEDVFFNFGKKLHFLKDLVILRYILLSKGLYF